MENDSQSLYDLYEAHYLRPQSNNSQPITESVANRTPEREIVEEKRKFKPFAKKAKGKAKEKSSKSKAGTDYGLESVNFDNVFDKIIREEFGDEGDVDSFASDDSYDFDGEGDDLGDGEEQTFSLSELRSMSLGELADLIAGGDSTDEFSDEGGDETFEMEDGDEIPQESYAFDGGGRSHGMQGSYDGKAKTGSKSNHVKDNGDSDFSKQDTGYDPEDTEGSEGSEHGMQGEYDGKAKTGSKSTHVKGNGDSDFGKQKSGAKTSSGKKDKNYF